MSPVRRRSRKAAGRRGGIHPLAVASLTIFLTAFVIFYAFNQGLPFVQRFTLHAYVNNSVAVRSNDPVRIAGIDVGHVQSTSPAGRATVINFTVDDHGQPVHKDATIRIRSRLFLEGGYYLELDPGSPSGPVLPDGGNIPMSQTASPVQFYNVLSTFDIAARKSLEDLLNNLNDGFSFVDSRGQPVANPGAVGLKHAIPQLTPVLKDIAWVTRALHGTHPGDVQTLLSTASDVTTTLSHNSAQLTDLLTSLSAASSALAAADGALAQSVSGLDQTLRVAPASLTAIDRALPPTANLGLALEPSLKLAPPLLDGLTTAVTQLAAVVAPTARGQLLTSLRTTFQQFPDLLTKLARVFPITQSVTDCLRTHITPVLSSVVPDGALTTNRPAWQDFVHFAPHLASSVQNFDANGPWIRFLAGAGTNTLSLGNLPIVGQLLGSSLPGGSAGSTLVGARPQWVHQLGPGAFQPGVPCASQKLPSLTSPTAAPDLGSRSTPAAQALSPDQLRSAIARAANATTAGNGR
jgi:virulence factor Mce-like protein